MSKKGFLIAAVIHGHQNVDLTFYCESRITESTKASDYGRRL